MGLKIDSDGEKKTQVLLMNCIYLGDSRKGNSQQKFE